MDAQSRLVIRSWQPLFRLQKRWYTLDRWRIPWAPGLPQQGVLYAAAALVGVLILNAATGAVLTAGPPTVDALVVLGLPVACSATCLRARPDGRGLPASALALLRWAARPKYRVGWSRRRTPAVRIAVLCIEVLPDLASRRYRNGRLTGPARVSFRYPVELRCAGMRIVARGRPGAALRCRRNNTLVLGSGDVLEVKV